MARKNLAGRSEITDEVLRQRRDLYVVALALILYYLAGGTLQTSATITSVLPITLKHPLVLLLAAWIAMFYFWLRLWLLSDAKAFSGFLQDARWQAGDMMSMRRIAGALAIGGHRQSSEDLRRELLRPTGPVPLPGWDRLRPVMHLSRLSSLASTPRNPVVGASFGKDKTPVPREHWPAFVRCWIAGLARATYRERTFTDYTLPNLTAWACVGLGILFEGPIA